MSWEHVCGIGFDLQYVTDSKLANFILNHEESYRKCRGRFTNKKRHDKIVDKTLNFIKDKKAGGNLTDDGTDLYYELAKMNETFSIADIIAKIMSVETNIHFDVPGCTDADEDYVLFYVENPWELNETKKSSMIETMGQYASELGLDVEPDVDLEYPC